MLHIASIFFFCFVCDICLPNFLDDFHRGRHASKLTEEEEDEEYLKEEEDGLAGTGGTRLVTQPSCKYCFVLEKAKVCSTIS